MSLPMATAMDIIRRWGNAIKDLGIARENLKKSVLSEDVDSGAGLAGLISQVAAKTRAAQEQEVAYGRMADAGK